MLTPPLTVLNIRCPSVGGYLMLKTVKGAVNINYWWVPYAYNCERGC
jgi:hypothetical protein